MRIPFCFIASVALAMPAPTVLANASTSLALPSASASLAPPSALADHGKLPWFQGSFDELVKEATKSKKLVFIDFWTSWCGWCKRLDADTFSDSGVIEEMKDVLVYSVDAESETGAPLAKRFGANSFPTLVFLDSDGSQRDRISGYLAPKDFVREVRRIKSGEGTFTALKKKIADDPKNVFARLELAGRLRQARDDAGSARELEGARANIAKGEGFDPKSIDDRWRVAEKLMQLGDQQGFQVQIAAIRALDPEEKSVVMRRMKLKELLDGVQARYQETQTLDTAPIVAFLAGETNDEVLFQGWTVVHQIQRYLAEEARKREKPEEAKAMLTAARTSARNAWTHCPPEFVAEWGKYLASTYYEDSDDLTEDEKKFAVEVAEKALAAAPKSAAHHETLACSLFAAGRRDEAVATLERGLGVEPGNTALRERLAEFKKPL